MIPYVPRVGLVYSKKLTNKFVQILTKSQMTAIRGFKAKVRVSPNKRPGFFDISFCATPSEEENSPDGDGFLSYTGSGMGDTMSPSNGFWARTRSTGLVVIEVITYG